MRRFIGWTLRALILIVAAFVLYLFFWPAPPNLPTAKADAPQSAPPKGCTARRDPVATTVQTLTVQSGEKIQDAVSRAHAGDTVLIPAGTYHEAVVVEENDIALRGVSGDARPVLDGQGLLDNGVLICGDNVTVENLNIQDYRDNGVLASGVFKLTLRDLRTDRTGDYGLFPIQAREVLIERCVATAASDTGIYVGQSQNVTVRDSEAYENVSGFEVENSVNVLVSNNYSHDNAAGLLVFVLPDLSQKTGRDAHVIGNRLIANNNVNFAPKGEIVAGVPSGAGLLIMGVSGSEVTGNEVRGNKSGGIAVISLRELFPNRTDFDVPTEPERNWIHDNVLTDNGTDPDPVAKAYGFPGVDLLWDASGWNNSWQESDSARRFPPILPGPTWPDPIRMAYWRLLNIARAWL